uniref:RRM domain-containing protein n=1 Tax=Leersia perrieri TaxID=77586 RepID=A0A0D9VJA7_9ORYZ
MWAPRSTKLGSMSIASPRGLGIKPRLGPIRPEATCPRRPAAGRRRSTPLERREPNNDGRRRKTAEGAHLSTLAVSAHGIATFLLARPPDGIPFDDVDKFTATRTITSRNCLGRPACVMQREKPRGYWKMVDEEGSQMPNRITAANARKRAEANSDDHRATAAAHVGDEVPEGKGRTDTGGGKGDIGEELPSTLLPSPPTEAGPPMMTSDEDAKKGYADFEEKVKRTIYIDHLSPQVTSSVIEAAFSQCANVVNMDFIVNCTIPYDIPSAALVELDDEIQAKAAFDMMNSFPFIIGGTPRPVRAIYATPDMFRDRPPCPGINKEFRWVKQEDGIEYEGMRKLRLLARRHEEENMALIKNLLEEEKELAWQQQELLDGMYKKYSILESGVKNDIDNLTRRYGVNLVRD